MDNEPGLQICEGTCNVNAYDASQARDQDARTLEFTRDFTFDAGTYSIHIHALFPSRHTLNQQTREAPSVG